MKNTLIIIMLFLSVGAWAQHEKTTENQEKIKALKVAFITEKLDLSSSEAEKFWPLHNEFQEKVHKLKKASASNRKIIATNKELTETETKKILLKVIQLSKDRNDLTIRYYNDLLHILPAKKVIIAIGVEKEFKRKMINEYRKRHTSKDKKNNY